MAEAPGIEHEERMVSGIVIDNRSDYILANVNDKIDTLLARVQMQVLDAASRSPLSPDFCIAQWYKVVALAELRRDLTKDLQHVTTNIGRR